MNEMHYIILCLLLSLSIVPSMALSAVAVCSFSLLRGIPRYEYSTGFSTPILLLVDIWVISTLGYYKESHYEYSCACVHQTLVCLLIDADFYWNKPKSEIAEL